MERRIINPWIWTDYYGVGQGVEITGASRTVICSGQIAVDAEEQLRHAGDRKAQVKLALDNLETVLRRADMTFSDVVRMNVYTTDMDALVAELAEGGVVFTRLREARCCPVLTGVGVTRLAFPELRVEIEATAMK